jgi:hypothetical protein
MKAVGSSLTGDGGRRTDDGGQMTEDGGQMIAHHSPYCLIYSNAGDIRPSSTIVAR